MFLTAYRLIEAQPGRRAFQLVAAAVGALLLAFSSVFWAYSVVAEVFALNNLLAALLLFVGCEWCRRPDRVRLLWLLALLLGLAFSNQQTIVLLVPALAVLGLRGWRRVSLRTAAVALGALVAGLLPYLYLPIAASADPAMNWGDPTSWTRFVNDVTRGDYGTTTLVAGGRSGSIATNLGQLWAGLVHGFVYAGILLAIAGIWWAWQHRRLEGVALVVGFIVAGPLFQAYTRTAYPDPLTKGIVARFYILPSIPLAILAALGSWWVLAWLDRRKSLVPAARRCRRAARSACRVRREPLLRRRSERQPHGGELRARPARRAPAECVALDARRRELHERLLRPERRAPAPGRDRPRRGAAEAAVVCCADEARASRSRHPVHPLRRNLRAVAQHARRGEPREPAGVLDRRSGGEAVRCAVRPAARGPGYPTRAEGVAPRVSTP